MKRNNDIDTDIDITTRHKPVTLTEDLCTELLQRIETVIDDTCLECGYDKTNIKATNWNYIMHQIYMHVFRPHLELIREYNYARQCYNGGDILPDNVEAIYEYIYTPLCDKYGQVVSQYSIQKMLGFSYAVFNDWNRIGRVTSNKTNLYKKMLQDREKSLQSAMLSSNTNPIKFLALGNHEFAWNESKPVDITEKRPELSLNDLPELESNELSDNYLLPFNDDTE